MKKIFLGISLFSLLIGIYQSPNADKPFSRDLAVVLAPTPANAGLVGKSGTVEPSVAAPFTESNPRSPVVVVPSKQKPSAPAGPTVAPLTPQAQRVMAQFNQDLTRRVAASPATSKPVMSSPLPTATPKAPSFQELLIKLENLRKAADKQLGFFSGNFSIMRNITGSECQNAYINSRDTFDKMKKTYDLGGSSQLIGPRFLSFDPAQAAAAKSATGNCLSSCAVEKTQEKKRAKYGNYLEFCKTNSLVSKIILLKAQAYAELKGALVAFEEIKKSPNNMTTGNSCYAAYKALADTSISEIASSTRDFDILKSRTKIALSACDPTLPELTTELKGFYTVLNSLIFFTYKYDAVSWLALLPTVKSTATLHSAALLSLVGGGFAYLNDGVGPFLKVSLEADALMDARGKPITLSTRSRLAILQQQLDNPVLVGQGLPS